MVTSSQAALSSKPAEVSPHRAADPYGLDVITAPAGSLLLMDMTVVHGSSVNITPLRRLLLYINVCPVNNRGETFERPDYYATRDFSPIVPLAGDCLTD